MRRSVLALAGTVVAVAVMVLGAPSAGAQNVKFTFNDVALDGQTVEIEAGVKILKNKPDSVTCSYFTDDYQDSLGYYFDFHEPAPVEADEVLAICIAEFDERHT
ncbi:MAG TPA: hypothetical protein VFZ68_15000 [Acidimicrobiales bacterium]